MSHLLYFWVLQYIVCSAHETINSQPAQAVKKVQIINDRLCTDLRSIAMPFTISMGTYKIKSNSINIYIVYEKCFDSSHVSRTSCPPEDHDTFEAGSSLSGAIFISNERHLSAKELRITFKGEERTRVVDKESKRSSDENFLFHTYSQEVKDVIDGGKIRSGKFIVPFKMQLPDELPQTVTLPWTHLSYVVGCELEDQQGNVVEHASAPVNILAMPCLHMPTPFNREPFIEYVKKNRFKRGHFVITVAIDDTVVEPGEQVGVSVAIRNRSPVSILKVKAMMKEMTVARAGQQERTTEKILTFHEFKEYRKTRRKRSKWLRGTDPQEDLEEIQEELESEEHEGTLRVPKVRLSLIGHNRLPLDMCECSVFVVVFDRMQP